MKNPEYDYEHDCPICEGNTLLIYDCPECEGFGFRSDVAECKHCQGEGWLEKECPACEGSGRLSVFNRQMKPIMRSLLEARYGTDDIKSIADYWLGSE